jgi:hypothetical protein
MKKNKEFTNYESKISIFTQPVNAGAIIIKPLQGFSPNQH